MPEPKEFLELLNKAIVENNDRHIIFDSAELVEGNKFKTANQIAIFAEHIALSNPHPVYVLNSAISAPNGVAALVNGVVPLSQIPNSLTIGVWADASARPQSPVTGQLGVNRATGIIEQYNGSVWLLLTAQPASSIELPIIPGLIATNVESAIVELLARINLSVPSPSVALSLGLSYTVAVNSFVDIIVSIVRAGGFLGAVTLQALNPPLDSSVVYINNGIENNLSTTIRLTTESDIAIQSILLEVAGIAAGITIDPVSTNLSVVQQINTLFFDTFSNGTALNTNHTIDVGTGPYILSTSLYAISNNKAVAAVGDSAAWLDMGSDSGTLTIDIIIPSANNIIGFLLRRTTGGEPYIIAELEVQQGTTGVRVVYFEGPIKVYEGPIVAGIVIGMSGTLKVVMNGTNIKMFFNEMFLYERVSNYGLGFTFHGIYASGNAVIDNLRFTDAIA